MISSSVDFMTAMRTYLRYIDTPMAFLLLAVGVLLSILTNFPQIRNFRNFIKFLRSDKTHGKQKNTMSPTQALFTAMSTSLGMGCIAVPPLAVAVGGPGALFWLVVYSFFGCVTKFTEVVFSLHFKSVSKSGYVFAGPAGYLAQVHNFWAYLYSFLTLFLFAGWSSLQSKTLSSIYHNYLSIPEYATGIVMAIVTVFLLSGGSKTIGNLSTKLVPVMCTLYFGASFLILFKYASVLIPTIKLIFVKAFTPTAAVAGFMGSTALNGLREGTFKGAFITESGLGTAAIPHSLAETTTPTNQGILALYSVAADTVFCLISGLVALVTGVWSSGVYSNALIFQAFKIGLPGVGPLVLVFIITLFIIGTTIGNSFNGSQSFLFITNNRWIHFYHALVVVMIFIGAIAETEVLWTLMEIILPFVALSNIFCLVYLAIKNKKVLQT
jgi:alanine or glycine:cation symporter, AGCS family